MRGTDLTMGKHRSCGCLHIDKITKHGQAGKHNNAKTRSRAYRCWQSMKTRCLTTSSDAYPFYGGRGITIYEPWLDFATFVADMGDPPSARHSLDRFPNKRGNYEPGNLRWATPRQQSNNTAQNRLLTYKGKTQTVMEWSRELDIPESRIRGRLRARRSIEDVLAPGKLSRRK